MMTPQEAVEAAQALAPEYEGLGTFYVKPTDIWEDAAGYALITGPREWLVDGDERYLGPSDRLILVDKATGQARFASHMEEMDRLHGMTHVPESN